MEYDWRSRFHLGLGEVGTSMRYGEAIRLLVILAADPSSQIAAELGGWSHPITRSDMTLRDLYDLQYMSKAAKRPRPYPRPWDEQPERTGAGTSLTVEQYRAFKASLSESAEVALGRAGRG